MSPPTTPRLLKKLLWVDCIGAGFVGVTVIAISGQLSELEGLPQKVLLFTGAMNLLYGTYSFSLAIREIRPLPQIKLLVIANVVGRPFAWFSS